MSSLRLLVSAVTNDALSDQDIRVVERDSIVNLWATAVAVGDTIGLRLGKILLMDDGTMNVSAAALGMIDTDRDQLIFNMVIGPGELRIPCPVVGTSLIFLLSVEPILL